jgi:hypothetical protein
MKKVLLLISIFLFIKSQSFSQSYNQDKIALTNFISRMYEQEPWSGVKVFLDYENKYLLSVVTLNPSNYPSESSMFRVAEIKSRAQSNQFLNGSYISLETIIKSERASKKNSNSVDEINDIIRETSFGFVESMELITSFSTEKNSKVFVYLKLLEKISKKNK